MHNIKILVILEPMVNATKIEFFRRKLGYEVLLAIAIKKYGCFGRMKFPVK